MNQIAQIELMLKTPRMRALVQLEKYTKDASGHEHDAANGQFSGDGSKVDHGSHIGKDVRRTMNGLMDQGYKHTGFSPRGKGNLHTLQHRESGHRIHLMANRMGEITHSYDPDLRAPWKS